MNRRWWARRRAERESSGAGTAPPAPDLLPPRRCEAGPTLADEDRQRELATFGFSVVPFLDAEALAACRQLAADVGPAPDDPRVALNWSFHSRSDEHKRSVAEALPLARTALEATFTDHVAFLCTFITKWPGPHSSFPPHQDPSLVDERRFTGVTVWVPLEDVDETNGMLHVIPGSHRFEDALRAQDVDLTPFSHLEADMVERHGRGVPVAAGEAMIFDNRVIHYSLPNRSERERVVLSFGMRPRPARCTVARHREDGSLAVWEVDDDFYTSVLPAARHHWQPTDGPIAVVDSTRRSWSEAEFEALCGAVEGPVPRAAAPTAGPPPDLGTALVGGVFCAICGSSEGLSVDDRRRRNNAQLVCPSCQAAVDRDLPVGT